MISDKITISMDEVERATPVPGTTPPPVSNCSYAPPESDAEAKPKRTGLIIGVVVAAVALLFISVVGVMAIVGDAGWNKDGWSQLRERTVSDYKAETIKEINAELSKPDSKLKEFIEDAHLTVTVKSTSIVRCDVTTVDGSEKAGKDDSNIDRVSLLIRFNWEGLIDTGYSDLRLEYDVKNDRLLKSEIEYTTALINVTDPQFWFGVGELIGAALL